MFKNEILFWRQRAKLFWIKDGDANTKYFHLSANERRRQNTIAGLFDSNGVWCVEDRQMEDVILKYFGDLFQSSRYSDFEKVISTIPTVISQELNQSLVSDITADEVFQALKQMHPSKSPGPDGFSPCFYQKFWNIVGADVVDAIRCFMSSEERLQVVNETFVTLIPKVHVPKHMHQLRPISLCNVIYKLGSKVLANRIKPVMDMVISPFQGVFVPGRIISDNSIVAFELAHFMKNRRSGNKGYGALKVDMSKAYDRVEWRFLEAVL